MRKSSVERNTNETKIKIDLDIDGTGKADINTGIGFFDHMLEGFTKHGLFDMNVKIDGDLNVDCHHSIEDCGIVLGQAIKEAIGDKKSIKLEETSSKNINKNIVVNDEKVEEIQPKMKLINKGDKVNPKLIYNLKNPDEK